MSLYSEYVESFSEDIDSILDQAKCQPILFIGSGFSRRYAGFPGWEDLLKQLVDNCPDCKNYSYYKQVNKDNFPKTGQDLTETYFNWAWGNGKDKFSDDLFESDDASAFVKHEISKIFKELNSDLSGVSSALSNELELLKNIKPHAIITTNYDDIIEKLFPDYVTIIGNDVFRKNQIAIGEIFKIHGCISRPETLIFNEKDYAVFDQQHGYLSAKLLTYFIEHPLIFIGYSAQDKNIRKILSDVQKMVQAKYDLIPNIYFLEWSDEINEESSPSAEKEILVSDSEYMKIKSISAKEFDWVFRSFESRGALENVNIKTLRSFMARCYKMVISNIPTKTVNLNYNAIDHAVESDETFFDFFGFGKIDSPEHLNANYPYTITQLGEKLGGLSAHKINQIIKKIDIKHGVEIKNSDNTYHLKIKTGKAKGSMVRNIQKECLI